MTVEVWRFKAGTTRARADAMLSVDYKVLKPKAEVLVVVKEHSRLLRHSSKSDKAPPIRQSISPHVRS